MKKGIFTVSLLWIVLLGCCGIVAADAGTANKPGPGVIDIAGTVKALKQFKVSDDDPAVPLPARPLITRLKHQLRDLVSLTLNSRLPGSENIEFVRNALSGELKKQGFGLEVSDIVVTGDHGDRGYTYGEIRQITIDRPSGHPDLIGVTTTIGVCCGSDTSLYLFRKTGERWELILAQEAGEYEEISGAQGSFQYAVSSPSDSGQPYTVTKNVNPWCTSNWQSIRYRVMRQGSNPYQPITLLNSQETIYLGRDGAGLIIMQRGGFTIELDSAQRLDTGVLVRRHILAYRVMGDQVKRVPPFAYEPEGFLDEWFNLPWGEAKKWTLTSDLRSLRALHAMIRSNRSGEKSRFFTNFAFDPPACRVRAGNWQVGVEFSPYRDGGSLPAGTGKELYFSVVEKNGSYFLKGVSSSSVPLCGHQKVP